MAFVSERTTATAPAFRRLVLGTLTVLGLAGVCDAHPKTDIVYFTNGDRIFCEIKTLQRGKLTVKSVGFSTVKIEWDKISQIESEYAYQFELQSGIRYIGTPSPTDDPGKIFVETPAGRTRLDLARVVVIRAVDPSFWERIDGSVDVGYEFTQASTSTSWNLAADATYRAEKWEGRLTADSLFREQDGADPVNRQNTTILYTRLFEHRWSAIGIGLGEKNANQALEFRGLFGGGVARKLYQTDRNNISVLSTLTASREKFQDTDFLTNWEVGGGILYDTYRFSSPELQITADFLFLYSLSDSSRFRLQANAQAKLELIKDLFWSVTVYETFDRQPPTELANRNDFSLTTSFGWRF